MISPSRSPMNRFTVLKLLASLVSLTLVFLLGRVLAPVPSLVHEHSHEQAAEGAPADIVWTCSMHPQIRQPAPGSCPICAMDLIPLESDHDLDDEGELPRLRLSERASALMNLQTVPVVRRATYAELRLPGRVSVDETTRAVVSAWSPGRIDRLYVDHVGTRIQAGEHLAELYSPDLFGAQEEFLQALQAETSRGNGGRGRMIEAARTKLRLLGLSDRQIDHLEVEGEASTHLTYHSPVTGTVLERRVTAGEYVDTGSPMFSIADLMHLWVDLEAYESELQWLRYGQEVSIETTTFPGERFLGRIAFISPMVDANSRTSRVRVNLPNDERKLKPGMLAVGRVQARIAEGGAVYDEALAGKWISPMHPEIVKDGQGTCDICGMDLVPAEEIGYFAVSTSGLQDPLVIPASAPLLMGKRGIVYVRLPDTERPTFEARVVQLGNRLGDVYTVLGGLAEGELVVAHGQFKIDSELQIRGRPSMMAGVDSMPNPAGDFEADGEQGARDPRWLPEPRQISAEIDLAFSRELVALVEAYLEVVDALAADEVTVALEGLQRLAQSLEAIGPHRLQGEAHVRWMEQYEQLNDSIRLPGLSPSLEDIRSLLQELTLVIETMYLTFGQGQLPVLQRAFCPMVDGGVIIDGETIGSWLQAGMVLKNPYWGQAMLRCGEFNGTLGTNITEAGE